ncbi:MAG: GIY-YIG nuclease family protein [Proteobacteria bacterium]|nr:GIY-YIG nuclease family protein [Pseudomonadota bacterium]
MRLLIAVHIMANVPGKTLYVGATSDLFRRYVEHRDGLIPGFTTLYGLKRLVWWERHGSMVEAIAREKAIKHYVRAWKVNAVEREKS